MPINPDTLESIQTTEEVVKEFIPDPAQQYWFFMKLSKSLNFDSESRVTGFAHHLRYYRRQNVKRLFCGDNHQEVADKLGVSSDVVRKDLKWIAENKKAFL